MIHRFRTCWTMPTRCTITPIGTNFIHTPSKDHWQIPLTNTANLRSTISTNEWKNSTFINIFITSNTCVRRWTHTTILSTIQIITRRILMARWWITRILFDTRTIPIWMTFVSLFLWNLRRKVNKLTSFIILSTFTMKGINSIDTMGIILRTNNTFTIVDICFTMISGEARLTCTMIDNLISIENRMTFRCIILTWLRQTWINYLKKISSIDTSST